MLDELEAQDCWGGHVRDTLSVLFLQFGNQADARRFWLGLLPLMKSALTHLNEVKQSQGLRGFPALRTSGWG